MSSWRDASLLSTGINVTLWRDASLLSAGITVAFNFYIPLASRWQAASLLYSIRSLLAKDGHMSLLGWLREVT
jgi:hypothetical protein